MSKQTIKRITKEQFEWIRDFLWKNSYIMDVKFDINWNAVGKDIIFTKVSQFEYHTNYFEIWIYSKNIVNDSLLTSKRVELNDFLKIMEYLAGFEESD